MRWNKSSESQYAASIFKVFNHSLIFLSCYVQSHFLSELLGQEGLDLLVTDFSSCAHQDSYVMDSLIWGHNLINWLKCFRISLNHLVVAPCLTDNSPVVPDTQLIAGDQMLPTFRLSHKLLISFDFQIKRFLFLQILNDFIFGAHITSAFELEPPQRLLFQLWCW